MKNIGTKGKRLAKNSACHGREKLEIKIKSCEIRNLIEKFQLSNRLI